MINAKLNEVDKRVKEIQQDVKDIKHFLDSSERAKLFSALNELLKVNEKMLADILFLNLSLNGLDPKLKAKLVLKNQKKLPN